MRYFAIFCTTIFILSSCSNEENDLKENGTSATQVEEEVTNNTELKNITADSNQDAIDAGEELNSVINEEEIHDASITDNINPEAQPTESPDFIDNDDGDPKTESVSEKESSTISSSDQSSSVTKFIYITLGLFLVTLICLIVSTLLLAKEVRWRRRHTSNESVVFPNAHLDILEDLRRAWENLYNQIGEFTNIGLANQKENENLANKTIDAVSKFNSTIDSQQNEINRLKEGYDFSIKRHSVIALLEINELVEKFLAESISDESKEKLTKVDGYVKSNLEDLDIEDFIIDGGVSIRDLSPDEFEIDSVENTVDDSLHEKVKETTKKGFAFIHENGKQIIRKAKLTVYKKEN